MRIYISLVILLWHMAAYSAETVHFNLTIDAYSAPVSIHALPVIGMMINIGR
jgi:hypothetical protein